VPRVSAGRVTIRWLENDGAFVKAGAKIAELDNATFVTHLKERALVVSQAEIDLKRQEWQNNLTETDATLDVQRKRATAARAEIDADVPPGILPKRDFLEKQMALRRARSDLAKSEETLATLKHTIALDLQIKRVSLDKISRDVKQAEQMIDALTLRAPADGTVLIGDHYEGRKLQVADDVTVGLTVARMPDLRQIRVKAQLSDVDDERIAAGMPVEVVLDAFPGRVLAGKVLEIAPVARELNDRSLRRVFQVSVAIAREGGTELRPGMSARVEVIADRRDDVVLVPRAALEGGDGAPAVRLVGGERREIALGPCNPQDCVATNLPAGTRLKRGTP